MKLILMLAFVLCSGCATEMEKWFVGSAAYTDYQHPENYGGGVNFGRSFKVGRVGLDVIPLDVHWDSAGNPGYGPVILMRLYPFRTVNSVKPYTPP